MHPQQVLDSEERTAKPQIFQVPWYTQGIHIPLLFYVNGIQEKIKGKIWTAKPKFLLEETVMSSEEETAI